MDISKDERELYDRQIRIWGLEGQGRLNSAKVLIIGLHAASLEAVKNLVLAGVGAITLQSDSEVTVESLGYNFFVTQNSVGQNVAEASLPVVQKLNPRVSLSTVSTPVNELTEEYVSQFDVVIASQLVEKNELIRLNDISRKVQHAFYLALVAGWGALLFVDLVSHEFVQEKELLGFDFDINKLPAKVPQSSTQEILHAVLPVPDSGSNTTKLTLRENYVSLRDVLHITPTSSQFGKSMRPRVRSNVSPYLTAFLAYIDADEDADLNTGIKKKAQELGLNEPAPEFLSEFNKGLGVETSAIGSVVGGLLAQEVLNYLTRRELPIQNILVYDGLRGKGPVYYLH